MTVCIAAICESGGNIIGASDRMRAAGNITFESSQKFLGITESIAIMTAGEDSFHTEILLKLTIHVKNKGENYKWLVKEIVDEYI